MLKNNNFKCILLILILLSFLNVGYWKSSVFSAEYSPMFTVTVTPDNAGIIASYFLSGTYSTYDNIVSIRLNFPYDTTFQSAQIPPGSIFVNGMEVKNAIAKANTKDNSTDLLLYLSKNINAGEKIEVQINKSAGIVNPTTPAGCYRVYMYLIDASGKELSSIISFKYTIGRSALKNVSVEPEVPIVKASSGYKVRFTTGIKGSITSSDEIKVKFPSGFLLPSIPEKSYVYVNGNEAHGVYLDGTNPNTLRIYSSVDIGANSEVELYFKKEFGIRNTSIPGEKVVSVMTSAEPTWVDSAPFSLLEPNIQNLSIKIEPENVGLYCLTLVNFVTSNYGSLYPGDHIFVAFPDAFDLTKFNQNEPFLLNGDKVQGVIEGNILKLTVQKLIPANSEVEIIIPKEANIKNPSESGEYTFQVWTDDDSSKMSFSVKIIEGAISNVLVEPTNTKIDNATGFILKFTVGEYGTLLKDKDSIVVLFDEGFVLPDNSSIITNLISVNSVPVPTASISGNSLNLIVPIDIRGGSEVKVEISKDFGIRNPSQTGKFHLQVYTSKEKTPIFSNDFEITELPTVSFEFEPQNPTNGIYNTRPTVYIKSTSGIKIFYRIDDSDFMEYLKPFTLGEGEHIVFAYATDENGNKGEIQNVKVVVDVTPPQITIDNVVNGEVFLNDSGIISGKVSEPCKSITVNGQPMEIKDDLTFKGSIKLEKDRTPLLINAIDNASNSTVIQLIGRIDNVPPIINIIDPISDNFETTSEIYAVKFTVNEPSKVFVGDTEVSGTAGKYSVGVNLIIGENKIKIRAVDYAGNESYKEITIVRKEEKKIILVVSEKRILVDGQEMFTAVAPFVKDGVTFVPIRVIAEMFGANVEWIKDLQAIKISFKNHSITLMIDSKIVLMDDATFTLQSSPVIVNGTTFVPLRFIAEAFGAHVDWDGTTKTITITYKP